MIECIIIKMQDNDGNTVYSKAHVDELKNTNVQWLTDALNLDDFQEKSNEEYIVLKKDDFEWYCEMWSHTGF